MSFLAWIIVGLVAGWLAKALFPGPDPGGFLATLLIGVVGAIVGGWIFTAFGQPGATGVNIWSIIVATIGAIVFLAIWRALVVRRPV